MRSIRTLLAAGAAIAAVAMASSASATVYDAVAGFHGGANTGVWTYGVGSGGSFTAMTDFSTACEGVASEQTLR